MKSGTQKPTLLTITHNTWESYTSRLISQMFSMIPENEYAEWIIVDNSSDDGSKLASAFNAFPVVRAVRTTVIYSDQNIGDLPQYNRIIERFVKTEKVICISTDMRLFRPTVFYLSGLLGMYDMVGSRGITMPREAADIEIGKELHWVPKLLVDRGIEFENTSHIQTHCFGVRRSSFLDAGGFWEPEDKDYLDKGNLITGEVEFGTRMRRAGKLLGFTVVPGFHYGGGKTYEELDNFDRRHGWNIDFPRYL